MKRRNIFLSLFLIFTAVTAAGQKFIEFTTTKQNSEKKNIKTVLITGMGKTPARIFLDNLGDELIKNFKSRSIESKYVYSGADIQTADDQLNQFFSEQKYDVILIISEFDNSTSERISRNSYTSFPMSPGMPNSPRAWGVTRSSKIFFNQKFKFRIFEKNTAVSFWEASLDVVSDLSKKSIYSDISSSIIKSLQQNRFFW